MMCLESVKTFPETIDNPDTTYIMESFAKEKEMTTDTIINTIDFLHKAPFTTDNGVDFYKLNEKAVIRGYFVHPECCNEIVDLWLDYQTTDYNSTFYKKWSDVTERSRFSLLIDQILHYATTYGSDFSNGNGFVQNEGSEALEYKKLKVIMPTTLDEIYGRCLDMIRAGVALKSMTVNVLTDFIVSYMKDESFFGNTLKTDIDSIKNKEAQALLSIKLNMFPSDEFGILRCLMYYYTNQTCIIKNEEMLSAIKNKARSMDMNNPLFALNSEQIVKLSRIFYRYKPIFLAMKTSYTRYTINRLRKLAKKNHTPLKIGFWESIVSDIKPIDEVFARVEELDNFKKIRLIQTIRVALYSKETNKAYLIRNGKTFVRKDYSPNYDKDYLKVVEKILTNSLIGSLSKKACRVKFPKYFDIKMPSSERTFVGNYPFGTTIDMTNNCVAGIYWRNEWNDRDHTDYDLAFHDIGGNTYSWCNNYKDDLLKVVYSGDMTNADPEASELMKFENGVPLGILSVNKYSGTTHGKFRFFVANEEIKDLHKNYMVNPNNIRLDAMIKSEDQSEQVLGLLHDGKFSLMELEMGKGRVSFGSDYKLRFIDTMAKRCECYLSLKDILLKAGFVEDNDNPEIDFTDIEKDTLINLISK